MRANDRIILNWVVLTGRSFASIAIALFTVRLVISAIGEENYGIFALLAITGGLLFIISEALTKSVSRHMGFELGRGDKDRFRAIFSTALLSFLVISTATAIGGWLVSGPVISLLEIPEERQRAATLVLVMSFLTVAATMLSTPFRGSLVAVQNHYMIAIISLSANVIRAGGAGLLFVIPGDPLVGWAAISLAVALIEKILLVIVCIKTVPGTRPTLSEARGDLFKELLSFGGWQFLNAISWRARMQIAQVIINSFFGPLGNATYGIGQQVASAQSAASKSGGQAVAPAVITDRGGEKHHRVRSLVLVSGRYMFLLTALVTIPLVAEMATLLSLWLGAERVAERLPKVVPVAQLICSWWLIESLAEPFVGAILSVGKIALYTIVTLTIDLLSLGGAVLAIFMLNGGTLEDLPVSLILLFPGTFVFAMLAHLTFRALYVGPQVGVMPGVWFRETALPCVATLAAGSAAAAVWVALLEPSIVRLVLTTAASASVTAGIFWIIGVRGPERAQLLGMLTRMRRKVGLG